MANIVEKMPEDDVLVIAGDGMFNDDLSGFVKSFVEKKESVVAIYEVSSLEDAKRCATVRWIKKAKSLISLKNHPSLKQRKSAALYTSSKKASNSSLVIIWPKIVS